METTERIEMNGRKPLSHSGIQRRGLIAGAAALVASLLVKEAHDAPSVAAATDGQGLVIGTSNSSVGQTSLQSSGSIAAYFESTYGNYFQSGVQGVGLLSQCLQQYGIGIKGLASAGVGVVGGITQGNYPGTPLAIQGITYANSIGGTGIQGINYGNADQTFGIEGISAGNGIGRIGVLGTVNATPVSTLTTGVSGLNLNTGPQAFGVFGAADAPGAVSIQGQSKAGIGVIGVSNSTYGVVGNTGAEGSFGIYGLTYANYSAAFAGGTNNPSAYGAIFTGKVNINGVLQMNGIPRVLASHTDGTQRALSLVASPENWVEDFGQTTLAGGKAEVRLDSDFLSLVDSSSMHAFFTEHGANHSLHLAGRSATGFTVQADVDALAARGKKVSDVNSTFSYRVVAKRKGVQSDRFEKVKPPILKLENPVKFIDVKVPENRTDAARDRQRVNPRT